MNNNNKKSVFVAKVVHIGGSSYIKIPKEIRDKLDSGDVFGFYEFDENGYRVQIHLSNVPYIFGVYVVK